MAKVNGARRERGQMILVAGITLALLFVALALLVNAAIYTDNLATRGSDSAAEPLEYRANVVDSVGGLIDAENAAQTDLGIITSNVTNGTEAIDDTLRQYHLRRGATTNASVVPRSVNDGLLIQETETPGFTSWSANASSVRSFAIELDTTEMAAGSPFVIDMNGTTIDVAVSGDGNITATGGTENVGCEVSPDANGMVRLDVTRERLGGEPCKFGWPTLDSDSEVGLTNAANGAGSYELTIDSADSTGEFPVGMDVKEALYSVEVALRMDTAKLRYETTVRIAPGEPDV
ncbi:MAG: hypothetical protein RI568_02315 [Natronomonas sp.]|uniref:DUF7261 family protein n=1 Tax=Natronomonas sp. TaxID=2184060 RepID=UPI00286FB517|nr:hypothetical protein [Natronomonas sp.]MDR9429525.1 hypothetical protein [Natronomonas sp.]